MASNIFSAPRKVRAPQSEHHDLSFDGRGSFDMGQLVPIMRMPVVPGDDLHIKCNAFVRFAPLLRPIMHRINLRYYLFFVPNRIVWKNWDDFIRGADDTIEHPYMTLGDVSTEYKSINDWMGIPNYDGLSSDIMVNSLPWRAYQKIYDDWFRDKEIQEEVFTYDGDGADDPSGLCVMRYRNWEKDYFTSANLTPQQGDPVALPIQFPTLSLVTGETNSNVMLYDSVNHHQTIKVEDAAGVLVDGQPQCLISTGNTSSTLAQQTTQQGVKQTVRAFLDPNGTLYVKDKALSSSGGKVGTIPELRLAQAMQLIAERGLFGENYHDWVYSTFGVVDSDARLQRSQFLGGWTSPVQVSEVTQTSSTDENEMGELVPLGDMAGHATTTGGGRSIHFKSNEYGWIIAIAVVSPRSLYFQGINRHLLALDRFDYYHPQFAQLGQQEIKNGEIFCGPDTTEEDFNGVFGYNDRYSQYKYNPSEVHGDFRDTMIDWHLGRYFGSMPALNSTFLQQKVRTNIFAVTDPTVNHLYMNYYFDIKGTRLIPRTNKLGF